MRFCLIAGWAWLAGAATLTTAPPQESVRRVTSVVRADSRTGRLVRTVKVSAPPAKSETEAIRRFAARTAELYDVDPLLVHSLIQVESNYEPFAVSPKGAQGLMQLMPGTAKGLAVKNRFSPWENIDGGVRHLKRLLSLFGDPRLAVAAYNAGEGAVVRYGGVPPYRETAEYVERVGKTLGAAKKAVAKQSEPGQGNPSIRQYVDSEGRVHLETRSAP